MCENEETKSGKGETPGIQVQEVMDWGINGSVVTGFQNSEFSKQSVHFMNQAQLQEKVFNPQDFKQVYNADKISLKLMRLIVNFYRENRAVFALTHHPIKEESSKLIMQKNLVEINKKALKLRVSELRFQSAFDQSDNETTKQCFWLNILNFMTLYKLAEIKLTKPEVLKKLTDYSMWQSFMIGNEIEITGHKLSQYDIFHSILRQQQ